MTNKDILLQHGFIFHNDITLLGGGFMFPDGTYLDLGQSYNNIGTYTVGGYKTGIHADVDSCLNLNKDPSMSLDKRFNSNNRDILVSNDNCIKLQDGMVLKFERPYIMLPKNKITSIQFDKLLSWLYDLYSKTYKFVNIHFNLKGTRFVCNRIMFTLRTDDISGGWYPEEIIQIIKKIYNIAENQDWEQAILEFKKLGGIG